MASESSSKSYHHMYAATFAEALDWPHDRLTEALRTLMSRYHKTEGTWGAIDALADLINKEAP